MIEFLTKLARRKSEVLSKGASDWQKLVGEVLDETASDADDVLDRLDRLGKSTNDLSQAVELLRQRRVWAQSAKDGTAAEADLNNATEQIKQLEDDLAKLLERHEAKLAPVERKKLDAIQRIGQADSARRRLVETASDPCLVENAQKAEQQMNDLRKEREQHKQKTRGLTINRDSILQHDDPALNGQAERLATGITRLRGQEAEFSERAAAISQASEAAREQLLRPEAI